MFTARIVLAVVAAGIIGTLANSIVVAALTDNGVLPLFLSPGRNVVAILVALLLPVILTWNAGVAGWIVSLLVLTVIPSILAKTVFGVGAPWGFVLGVNAVYAAAALAVYLLLVRVLLARPDT